MRRTGKTVLYYDIPPATPPSHQPLKQNKQGRETLPSKSRAIMSSIFNLSDSAIGPGFRTRPGLDKHHLFSRMTSDFLGFHWYHVQQSIAFAVSDKVSVMAARTTAHSTPFYPLLERLPLSCSIQFARLIHRACSAQP